jgi:hypothetical protein
MMGAMGNPSAPGMRSKIMNIAVNQAVYRERTTGFEPATLTLAKKT